MSEWDAAVREFAAVTARMEELVAQGLLLGARRREIAQTMKDAGLSYREIAVKLGITPGRVYQILNR
jgi:DNA-directed RNA polymerase specialized sigma subunit